MKSHSIWEFPVFWLVDTVVTWPKMRLWEISGLFETFGGDGSLQDTLKVSNRQNLKPFDFLFETFLIWNFCIYKTHLVFGFHRRRMCIFFRDLDTIWNFLIHYLKVLFFETFLIWNFLWKHSTLKLNFLIPYLKLFLNETFSYIKRNLCEITNNNINDLLT